MSFSSVPFSSTELSGNEAILVFGRQALSGHVEQVKYTEPWYIANPEKAAYIAGEGWEQQYTDPDECFDDEGWSDDDCLEEARAQAEYDSFAWKSDEQEWISKQEGSPVRFRPSDLKSIQAVRPSDVANIQIILDKLRGYDHVRVFLKGTKMASTKTKIPRSLATKLKLWGDDPATALFQVVKAGMTGKPIDVDTVDRAVDEIRVMSRTVRDPVLRGVLNTLELDHASDPFEKMARRVVARYTGKDFTQIGKNRAAWGDLKLLIERGDLGESPVAMTMLQVFNQGGKAPLVVIEKLVPLLQRAGGPHARRLLSVLNGLMQDAYGYMG